MSRHYFVSNLRNSYIQCIRCSFLNIYVKPNIFKWHRKAVITRRVSVRFWECVVVGGGGGGGWWGGSVCVWGYPGVKGGLLYRNC